MKLTTTLEESFFETTDSNVASKVWRLALMESVASVDLVAIT